MYVELQVGSGAGGAGSNVKRASGTYAWGAGSRTRQIVLAFAADSMATGLRTFTFVVNNRYTTGTYGTSVSGNLLIVNRRGSKYGDGWGLAGLEEVRFPLASAWGNRLLWLGGDGSAVVYDSVAVGKWRRTAGAYRDSIIRQTDGTFTRKLKHGTTVTFDATGRHTRTTDRLGYATTTHLSRRQRHRHQRAAGGLRVPSAVRQRSAGQDHGSGGWRGVGLDSIPTGHWAIEDGTIRKVASVAVPTAADGQPLEGGDIMTSWCSNGR